MKCSVYIVCPSVLSCSNLKLYQTLEVKNIFKQESMMLQLTFNPGLALTSFRTTRPCIVLCCERNTLKVTFSCVYFIFAICFNKGPESQYCKHFPSFSLLRVLFFHLKWVQDGFVIVACTTLYKLYEMNLNCSFSVIDEKGFCILLCIFILFT